MARNNLCWVKGDITSDIYYDILKLNGQDIQFLRLYLMVKGVKGSKGVKGLRTCIYGPMAELTYGHVRKGSRLGVIGHVQQRITRKGKTVFEIVAEEVEYIRNIDWETGERSRKDLVARGLLRPSHEDEDPDGGSHTDHSSIDDFDTSTIPDNIIPDEQE
jgi:single-stranded DNA-binding protein